MTDTASTRSALLSAAWCSFYGAGIIGALVIYGVLQERIMSLPYGTPPVLFTDSVFLVFCNRFVAVLFAVGMALSKGEALTNSAPFWKYLAISFSNVYASACQYEALKYVSFPVQMLGKSFKMMPVMVWGMAVSGKRYDLTDWLIAFAVTGGVTEFLMTGPISSSSSSSSTYGLALLGGFLLLDGFTSTFQEKLFKEHVTSKYNQMVYINLGSCLISSGTLLVSGRISAALGFARTHPAFAMDAMSLSAAAVSGQWFIYSQVKEFGALVFAATMNVRQVVSILISYAKYGHSITSLQIIGLLLVFAALFYKSFAGLFSSNESEKKPLLHNKNAIERTQVEKREGTPPEAIEGTADVSTVKV
jgi:adenosine 3'-phospho 5'-phosphosulfate transporter B2